MNDLDCFDWKEEYKVSLKANISRYLDIVPKSQPIIMDLVEAKKSPVIMLFHGPAGTGKTTIIGKY